MKFDLGDYVKDIPTGIKGTITSVSEFLTGCSRYRIVYNHNGKVEEFSSAANELMLEKKQKLKYPSVPFGFDLGDEIKDIVSGMTGVIMSRAHYSEYNRYGIQRTSGEATSKEALENHIHLDEANLKYVKEHPIKKPIAERVKKIGKAGPPRMEASK